MSDKKNSKAGSETATASAKDGAKKKGKKKKQPRNEGLRETVESIAIAFALAFVFKTFQAEAYVIPTGSMAPTLYGRHKEVTCDGCGFEFAIGASVEVDQNSGRLMRRIRKAYCTNCGKEIDVQDAPAFNGDRIVVNKQVHGFDRFDVVVFKNPEEGHVNYIKRLVGLPGETIRIRHGDLWGKKAGSDEWTVLRKDDPDQQKAIQLVVYDDNHPATEILEQGWPERWAPSQPTDTDVGWKEAQGNWTVDRSDRTYSVKAPADEWSWIRYRHFQPNDTVWREIGSIDEDVSYGVASLISDACSFNAYPDSNQPAGVYWVGDLTINTTIDLRQVSEKSQIRLQLVEGSQTFNATIEPVTGTVTLTSQQTNASSEDTVQTMGTGQIAAMSTGTHELTFANVDDRLCVWVDDQLVEFDGSTTYGSGELPDPGPADLAPCGIAVLGAEVTVSDLLLERDIYYRNLFKTVEPDNVVNVMNEYDRHRVSLEELSNGRMSGPISLFEEPESGRFVAFDREKSEASSEAQLQMLLTDPIAYAQLYRDETLKTLQQPQFSEYELADDEYLMLGDNSPSSKDSRLFDYYTRPINGVFSHRYAVREKDLIGKALFIFWPHGVPFLNDGQGFTLWSHKGPEHLKPEEYPWMRAPFYPHISRMKKIR